MNVYFGDRDYYDLERRGGLLYVTLQIIDSSNTSHGTDVEFILDTGAFLTVISRGTAIQRGLNVLLKKATVLYGFGGGIPVDYVIIPGLRVLGKIHSNVPVLIPHDLYRIDDKTGERRQMPEVLGLNILEYYNYYIDTENSRLYLRKNLTPRFYSNELASGEVIVG